MSVRKLGWWIVLLLLVALAGGWYWKSVDHEKPSPYRFATVERGDIEATVSATGALSAVKTVQVGTQVSGQIAAIYADFNDKVKQGQRLARIDPVIPEQAVAEALAGVERSQAQYDAAKREYERNQRLFDEKLLPASELTTFVSGYEVAKANLTSARVSLDRAKRNLEYTSIQSPIDGVIVERNVDVGQTVAASMQAPTLFVLARDLKHMQVNASVDEADIGRIQPGQPVTFQVDAYSGETFTGTVKQVRLQPKVEQNVVSYVTVIDVPNEDLKLKPGMTANVTIEIARADNVLRVPNAALRFRPTTEVFTALGQQAPEPRAAGQRQTPGGAGNAGPNGNATAPRRTGGNGPWNGGTGNGTPRGLWVLADGRLSRVRAQFGISDGTTTAVEGGDLQEGAAVVTGVATPATAAAPSSNGSPLLPRRPGQRGGAQQQAPARSR
jgi:HlyD family secretion protein